MSSDICGFCLNGEHRSCAHPGQDMCCSDWSRISPPRLKAFKFIAEQTPVPDVGTYIGCATVALGESVDVARAAIHAWGRTQSPPDDTRWVDHCPFVEVELKPGAVLLFVMQ